MPLAVLLAAVLSFTLISVFKARSTAPPQPGAAAPAPPPAGLRPEADGPPPQPTGQRDGWEMAFSDEFDGDSLDMSMWSDHSSAQGGGGHGNTGNQQLEWNQAANCRVAGGELVMTARRQRFTAPGGARYDWTSCLLTTAPSYAFQYGFIEERAILPAARGFWPAFWTWQAPDVDRHVETDVYEFFSDNHSRLYLTQHSGGRGRCEWKPSFDPTADWHTYAAAIEPSGTTWYVDGAEVCRTRSTSDAPTNIITNLAVYSEIPPAASTSSAVKRVDYVRAWRAR